MAWGRTKNAVARRLQELEAERRSTAKEIAKIHEWVGEAREGHVELAPPPRKNKPLLGVEKRRARVRFGLWMVLLAAALLLAWRVFFGR